MTDAYDDGYRACPCFWGRNASSLVLELDTVIDSLVGLRVLDLGCGEGKNAAYLAQRGAMVDAVDSSALAIKNAQRAWPDVSHVAWQTADIRQMNFVSGSYDVIVAYGLLHCLQSPAEVSEAIARIQDATVPGGFNVLCAFNSRAHDMAAAHPGFMPTLLSHTDYEEFYQAWRIVRVSDSDLHEVHPHNNIPHSHSMTRLIAQKP